MFNEFLEASLIKSTRLIAFGINDVSNANSENDLINTKIEMTEKEKYADCSEAEKKLIALLRDPMPRDELIRELGMNTGTANALISIMEIKELIKEEYGEIRKM